ncbi:MAG TPA: L-histidine N(alpha)-methyltransferase, partial [Rhodocyclaceae bacterium]|nr:L-histidine N(alpha)-methyltransferase [Rhodocyclaceae bacterium]
MMANPAQLIKRVIHDDFSESESAFAHDLIAGLLTRPRVISPKYFYDAAGSALFDAICELPEYYPTRTELGILTEHASDMARHIGPQAEIIEFGAGSSHKIRLLLDALDRPRRFVPIDISGEHLHAAAASLRRDYPALEVHPVVADFTRSFSLPLTYARGRRVGFFPGSSIGNFMPDEAIHFLKHAAGMLRGGGLLIGTDLVKDPALLHAAYNDADGITAQF